MCKFASILNRRFSITLVERDRIFHGQALTGRGGINPNFRQISWKVVFFLHTFFYMCQKSLGGAVLGHLFLIIYNNIGGPG